MSKRLLSHPNRGRSLRPKSLQKAKSTDAPDDGEERRTLPEVSAAGASDQLDDNGGASSPPSADAGALSERTTESGHPDSQLSANSVGTEEPLPADVTPAGEETLRRDTERPVADITSAPDVAVRSEERLGSLDLALASETVRSDEPAPSAKVASAPEPVAVRNEERTPLAEISATAASVRSEAPERAFVRDTLRPRFADFPAALHESVPVRSERTPSAETASAFETALAEAAKSSSRGARRDEGGVASARSVTSERISPRTAEILPPPASHMPSSGPKIHAVELLESGISAEFFRNDEDSVPPSVDHLDESDVPPAHHSLSPAALERRGRLRRVVAGVVTFAAVLSIGVLGKQLVAPKPSIAAPLPARQESVVAAAPPPPAPAAAPAPQIAEAVKADPMLVKADPPPPEAKAENKAVVPADAGATAAPEPEKTAEAKADPAAAVELKKEAERLLNLGKRKEAIAASEQAIQADPSDATPYLLLGSALQDSGKWKEGLEAYSECVRHATRGPINECRAVGGHK